ncbi:hypothetical protein TNCV_4378761 [Trichonephila clavipes]|nr:hypothetical protein TNCV_4378761 [Trichonephila clavipes]
MYLHFLWRSFRAIFFVAAPHQVTLQLINFCIVQSIAKLATGSPKMMPIRLHCEHFAMFPLIRHYNTGNRLTHNQINESAFWYASGVFYTEFLTKERERQLRFGTIGLLVVLKMEGDIVSSTFFNGCLSSSSHEQMDTQPTRIFLLGQNEEMDRMIEQMRSR